MKIRLVISLLFSVLIAHGQFTDDFSDGNFSTAPNWASLEASNFEVLLEELHLNAPAVADISHLATASQAIDDAIWQFDVRLDFNPSGSNFAKIYLVADQPDLEADVEGYFVMVGGSTDEVSLYKQSGSNETEIIDGVDDVVDVSDVHITVKVQRDALGVWQLFVDADAGADDFQLQGNITDNSVQTSSFFGVSCVYTQSRSDKFYFDNFQVSGNPGELVPIGNTAFGSLLFNEVMADPSPVVGLPEVEYLELYNNTVSNLQLSDFTLVNTNTEKTLPSFVMPANSYILVCDEDDVAQMSGFGAVVGIAGFSALSNSGDSLTLINQSGALIDVLVYEDDWHENTDKKAGGWSLERINPQTFCSASSFWRSSQDGQGGTPGTENSVFDLSSLPGGVFVSSAQIVSSNEVEVEFSDVVFLQNSTQIFIDQNQVSTYDLDLNTLAVTVPFNFQVGEIYTLELIDFKDCVLDDFSAQEIQLAIGEQAQQGDLIINEVLFNPIADGVDFVEIYNRSDKNINLSGLMIAKEQNGVPSDPHSIGANTTILKNDYLAFSIASAKVLDQYPLAKAINLIELNDMPAFNNDQGVVLLMDTAENIYDRLAYDEQMHFELLPDNEGFSLERISPQIASAEQSNWQSASDNVGGATPGYQNSQYSTQMSSSFELNFTSAILSPDADGIDDVLEINYNIDGSGFVANMMIYDLQGNQIQQILNNQLMASEGTVLWDPAKETSANLPVGTYVLYAEFFDLQAQVKSYKLPFAVLCR